MHLSCGPPLFNTNGTTPNSFYWTMHSPTFKSEDCNYYNTLIRVMVFCKVAQCNNSPACQVKAENKVMPPTNNSKNNGKLPANNTKNHKSRSSRLLQPFLILKCCLNALRNGTQLCGRLRLTNYESIEGALTFVWFIL